MTTTHSSGTQRQGISKDNPVSQPENLTCPDAHPAAGPASVPDENRRDRKPARRGP